MITMAKDKLNIPEFDVEIRINNKDYLSLTDIAKQADRIKGSLGQKQRAAIIIQRWLKNRSTLEFLINWEEAHTNDFKVTHLDDFRISSDDNLYIFSIEQWIELTDAKGIEARRGRYGGTYAHSDIAINFCYWLSPRFQIYMIKSWRELKGLTDARNVRRELTKANFGLLTKAIGDSIPAQLVGTKKAGIYYSSEMDLINMAVFGVTAKQWKAANPKAKGNIRDSADALDLLILSNLEAINTYLIKWDTDQDQRLEILTEIAEHQREVLPESKAAQRLIKKGKK